MDWKIYYGDGSTFTSDEGAVKDSPSFNVQAVVQSDPDVGRQILNGFDWYIRKEGRWYGVLDVPSLLDQVVHDLDKIEAVRMGRTIPSAQYKEIMLRAKCDEGFPRKSAISKNEKPHGSKD